MKMIMDEWIYLCLFTIKNPEKNRKSNINLIILLCFDGRLAKSSLRGIIHTKSKTVSAYEQGYTLP